jgi:hypothetical protein
MRCLSMMSEKPSDTSKLPDLPALLLDENLSSADIAQFLRRFPNEWRIELHTDHFARGMADVDVIRECASRAWVLVSCDDRIRYVPQNKAAVNKHRIGAFMFGKGNYQGVEYAAALIVGRSQILSAIRKTSPPFFARIQIKGDVNMLEPQPAASQAQMTSRERTERKYVNRIRETQA